MSEGWFLNGEEPIAVELTCMCPGKPHGDAGDTVWLRPSLDFPGGMLVSSALAREGNEHERQTMVERLGRAFLLAGIVRWTFLDAQGQPVPVLPSVIDRLKWSPAIMPLAEKASDLYGDTVLTPLVEAAMSAAAQESNSLLSGPSTEPTSATPRGSSKHRKRSRQSTMPTTPPSPPPS